MAASNKSPWVKNLLGRTGPLKRPILCLAGASQAIKRGEICDISSGHAVPLASDKDMTAGIIVIADSEVASGDLAGYREFIVPVPGDLFEFALASATNPAQGASVYFSDSQTVATSGTHALGVVCDESIVPIQGFQSVSPSPDAGSTALTTGKVLVTIAKANAYWSQLQT